MNPRQLVTTLAAAAADNNEAIGPELTRALLRIITELEADLGSLLIQHAAALVPDRAVPDRAVPDRAPTGQQMRDFVGRGIAAQQAVDQIIADYHCNLEDGTTP